MMSPTTYAAATRRSSPSGSNEAEQHYRRALDAGSDVPGLAERLERASANATTDVGTGERQSAPLRPPLPTHAEGRRLRPTRPTSAPRRPARSRPRRAAPVKVTRPARSLGAAGSAFFHGVTKVLGRNTNDRVWTNWYTAGKRLPGPAASGPRSSSSRTCASRCSRTTSCAPTPRASKAGYADGQAQVPEFARRWRTADGTWNDLRPDEPDGSFDPMVGAAYTRFFRNVGDDQGLAGVRRRENPATNPVSVREVSRTAARAEGAAGGVPVPQPVGRRRGSSSRTTTGSATAPTDGDRVDQIPLADDDPLRALRHRPPRRPRARSPTRPARRRSRRDCRSTFLNEVTHWWDGSQIYGSDWDTQHRCARTSAAGCCVTDDGLAAARRRRPAPSAPASCATGGSGWRCCTRCSSRSTTRSATCWPRRTPTGTTRRSSRPRGWSTPALMAKIHTHRVDAGDPAQREPARRHARQLVRPGHVALRRRAQAGARGHPDHQPRARRHRRQPAGRRSRTYGLAEEFVSIYRLHSLLPDEVRHGRRRRQGERHGADRR